MSPLTGTWLYQSYLIRPTPAEAAAPPSKGATVTASKWAVGTLTVATEPSTDTEVSGGLEFAPGVGLVVAGHVIPGIRLVLGDSGRYLVKEPRVGRCTARCTGSPER